MVVVVVGGFSSKSQQKSQLGGLLATSPTCQIALYLLL